MTSSLQVIRAIVHNDLRLLRREPFFVAVVTVMAILVMAFVKDTFRSVLVLSGDVGANGTEQAVPGMAVTFSFFLMGNVGFWIFQEHIWGTWTRLRTSVARTRDIMIGKTVIPLLTSWLQLAVMFGVGALAFHLKLRGSWWGIVLVCFALSICLVMMGLMLASLCRSLVQLNALASVGAVTLASLGGALVPWASLPGWARHLGPAVPTYWAMRGFHTIVFTTSGLSAVALPTVVLLLFAAAFALAASVTFRANDQKSR